MELANILDLSLNATILQIGIAVLAFLVIFDIANRMPIPHFFRGVAMLIGLAPIFVWLSISILTPQTRASSTLWWFRSDILLTIWIAMLWLLIRRYQVPPHIKIGLLILGAFFLVRTMVLLLS